MFAPSTKQALFPRALFGAKKCLRFGSFSRLLVTRSFAEKAAFPSSPAPCETAQFGSWTFALNCFARFSSFSFLFFFFFFGNAIRHILPPYEEYTPVKQRRYCFIDQHPLRANVNTDILLLERPSRTWNPSLSHAREKVRKYIWLSIERNSC